MTFYCFVLICFFSKARSSAGFRGTVRYASINAHDNKVSKTCPCIHSTEVFLLISLEIYGNQSGVLMIKPPSSNFLIILQCNAVSGTTFKKKKWIMLYSPFMSRNAQVNVGVNFFIQTQRQWAKKRCCHDITEEVNGHLVLSHWIKGKASVSLTGNGKTGWFVVILLHDGRVCKWTSTMEKNEG